MSQEQNVDLVGRVLRRMSDRDIEGLLQDVDVDAELDYSESDALDSEVYRGHDGLRQWHRDVEEVWGDAIRVEPEAYFDLGECVLMFYVLRGRGKQSGVEVAMPVALLTRWRNGLIVYLKAYAHREDALGDVGVSEDALQPIEP